jgi:hypothetical protein
MSMFPPDWQVYEEAELFSFGTAGLDGGGLGLHTLLQVHDSGRSTGLFRLVVTSQNLTLAIPLSELFMRLPDSLREHRLHVVWPVAEATPKPNTTVIPWVDVEEMIR